MTVGNMRATHRRRFRIGSSWHILREDGGKRIRVGNDLEWDNVQIAIRGLRVS